MATWWESMISREAGPNDAIASTTLNVTKFGGLFAAIATVVIAGIEKWGAGDALSSGQWVTLALGVLAFMGVLMVTDMAVRAYATAHETVIRNVEGLKADVWAAGAPHRDGNKKCESGIVEAIMVSDGATLLLVYDEKTKKSTWEPLYVTAEITVGK